MKHLLIGTALAVLAAPAVAGNITPVYADPVIQAPQVFAAPGVDWTGAYVGVQLGYGDLDVSGGSADDENGLLGGVHAGYDYDFGTFVLGVVGDYNFADTEVDGASMARLRARAGTELGNGLLYATGGVAFGKAEISGVDRSDAGWVAGIGYDHMVTENVSVGAEVLYHQFDDFDNSGLDINLTSFQAKLSYRF